MAKVSGNLNSCLRRLERALAGDVAGREREWARLVSESLYGLLAALQRHSDEADGQGGLMMEIDQTRPTLVRQANGLRREHTQLLDQTVGLWEQVQNARQTFEPPLGCPNPAATLPAPSIPDFGVLRRRTHELLNVLRRHEERETDLVLESVTTDIGVGD